MKQYLLLLAGLMILAPYGQADAKAVKLGRGNAYSVAADTNLNTGAGSAKVDTEKKMRQFLFKLRYNNREMHRLSVGKKT